MLFCALDCFSREEMVRGILLAVLATPPWPSRTPRRQGHSFAAQSADARLRMG